MNAGASVPNAGGWSRLPHGPIVKRRSVIWRKIVHQFDMGKKHSSAAVPFDTEVVQNFCRVF